MYVPRAAAKVGDLKKTEVVMKAAQAHNQ